MVSQKNFELALFLHFDRPQLSIRKSVLWIDYYYGYAWTWYPFFLTSIGDFFGILLSAISVQKSQKNLFSYWFITESFVLRNDAGSKNEIYWFLEFLSGSFWIFCPKFPAMGKAFTVKQLNIRIFYWDQLGYILTVPLNKVWRVFYLNETLYGWVLFASIYSIF